MKKVTDPDVLAQLAGGEEPSRGKKVTDPALLAQLEGKEERPGKPTPQEIDGLQQKLLDRTAKGKEYASVEDLRKANLSPGEEVYLSTASGRQRVKVTPPEPTFTAVPGPLEGDLPTYSSPDDLRKASGTLPVGSEVFLSTDTGRQRFRLGAGLPRFQFIPEAHAADTADAYLVQAPAPPSSGIQPPSVPPIPGSTEAPESRPPVPDRPLSVYREAIRASVGQIVPGFSVFPTAIQDAILDKAEELGLTPTAMQRGGRALGVGLQRAVEGSVATGKNPLSLENLTESMSFERGAAAFQPGFVPERGERTGALLGEAAASAPAFAVGGGGGVMAQALKGALTSGTISAIQQAADNGDIEIRDVIYSAVLGGSLPLIAPSIDKIINVVREVARVGAPAGTTLTREAVDALTDDPKLLQKFQGTAESVGEKVIKVQKALVAQHDKISGYLERVRQNIGFREPLSTQLSRVSKEGFQPKSVQDIVQEFQVLKKGHVPVEAIRAARKVKTEDRSVMGILLGKTERRIPGKITKTEMPIPDKLRLRELYRLREAIDDHLTIPQGGGDVPRIGRADQNFLQAVRSQVNSLIETIPGGKTLRMADQAYYLSRKLYDDLQKKLATQGKAEQVIQQILKGGDINEVIGLKGDNLRLLQTLERKTGQKLLEPIQKELAAKSFKEIKPTGYMGAAKLGVIGKGPEGGKNLAKGLNLVNEGANAAEVGTEGFRRLVPVIQGTTPISEPRQRKYSPEDLELAY